MATYPDVIGEYIDAPERFATGGLQYAGYFEPGTISVGQAANLYLLLQNTLNVPIEIGLKIDLPQSGGFLRSKNPLLQVEEEEIEVKLAAAEVGLLTWPIATTDHAEPGELTIGVEAKVSAQGKGERIRPPKSKSQLESNLLDSPVGLNLIGSLGATYVEKSVKKGVFGLKISDKPAPIDQRAPEMKSAFEIIWKKKEAKFFAEAVQEIHLREVKIKKELTVEALYVNLYSESTHRFADVGLPLRIGEAIVMGKILTYSCQYFLADPQRRNGLLVPIWEHALEAEVDTTDSLALIRSIGFHHVLRLSAAIGFGLIAQAFGRQFWSKTERQAVASHIADSVDLGQSMDTEFLYLPLLMAGTQICNKVQLQGEDVNHTLALIAKARDARIGLFSDQDMAQADQIYDRILKKMLG